MYNIYITYFSVCQYHADTLFPLIRDGHLTIELVAHHSIPLKMSVVGHLCKFMNT